MVRHAQQRVTAALRKRRVGRAWCEAGVDELTLLNEPCVVVEPTLHIESSAMISLSTGGAKRGASAAGAHQRRLAHNRCFRPESALTSASQRSIPSFGAENPGSNPGGPTPPPLEERPLKRPLRPQGGAKSGTRDRGQTVTETVTRRGITRSYVSGSLPQLSPRAVFFDRLHRDGGECQS